MKAHRISCGLVALVLAAVAILVGTPAPPASADPCPDIEVIFARGTVEPPGVGTVGQAFVDSVRAQAGGRTVFGYGVNYPASNNFTGGVDFVRTVVDGIRDEAIRVQFMASACPSTKLILAGYSQGAVVTAFSNSAMIPQGVPADSALPAPLPGDLANHVAAVVLFGKPAGENLVKYGAPPAGVGLQYPEKALDLCAPGDSVCTGTPLVGPNDAHSSYPWNGMVGQGAAFAVSRL